MHILIIYHSRNGHTQAIANQIARTVLNQHHTMTLKSSIEIQSKHIEEADFIFIGTWVQGFILFGVKPAGAESWVPALPDLQNKPVAIFCTYAFNPRNSLKQLKKLLEAKNATVIGEQAFHRIQSKKDVISFVNSLLSQQMETV